MMKIFYSTGGESRTSTGKPTAGGTPIEGRTIGGADEPLPGSVVRYRYWRSGYTCSRGVLVGRIAHEGLVDDPLAFLPAIFAQSPGWSYSADPRSLDSSRTA